MSPFSSKRQQKAAFGGYLGKSMQQKAPEFAAETDQSSLPSRASVQARMSVKPGVDSNVRSGIRSAVNSSKVTSNPGQVQSPRPPSQPPVSKSMGKVGKVSPSPKKSGNPFK